MYRFMVEKNFVKLKIVEEMNNKTFVLKLYDFEIYKEIERNYFQCHNNHNNNEIGQTSHV